MSLEGFCERFISVLVFIDEQHRKAISNQAPEFGLREKMRGELEHVIVSKENFVCGSLRISEVVINRDCSETTNPCDAFGPSRQRQKMCTQLRLKRLYEVPTKGVNG